MDETRLKALELALKCYHDGLQGARTEQILASARKIEDYLSRRDDAPSLNHTSTFSGTQTVRQ